MPGDVVTVPGRDIIVGGSTLALVRGSSAARVREMDDTPEVNLQLVQANLNNNLSQMLFELIASLGGDPDPAEVTNAVSGLVATVTPRPGTRPVLSQTQELGLAQGDIRIEPRFVHQDIYCDGLGKDIPAEVMWQLADCRIMMDLIHYDNLVLSSCIAESMGMSQTDDPNPPPLTGGFTNQWEGDVAPAGRLMGNIYPLGDPKNRFVMLCLQTALVTGEGNTGGLSQDQQNATFGFAYYRFPRAYLAERPIVTPLGTKARVVKLVWRAIPYQIGRFGSLTKEITFSPDSQATTSAGGRLWDHLPPDAPIGDETA